jgi:hypothetical protein
VYDLIISTTGEEKGGDVNNFSQTASRELNFNEGGGLINIDDQTIVKLVGECQFSLFVAD